MNAWKISRQTHYADKTDNLSRSYAKGFFLPKAKRHRKSWNAIQYTIDWIIDTTKGAPEFGRFVWETNFFQDESLESPRSDIQ